MVIKKTTGNAGPRNLSCFLHHPGILSKPLGSEWEKIGLKREIIDLKARGGEKERQRKNTRCDQTCIPSQ